MKKKRKRFKTKRVEGTKNVTVVTACTSNLRIGNTFNVKLFLMLAVTSY